MPQEEEQSFYKKHRPKTLADLVGSPTTIATVEGWFKKNEVPHAILITGETGTGKTTLARIIKDKLGCSKHDYKEYNSASVRGIDSIRDIQLTLNRAPTRGKCKMYLFDEVHQWTGQTQESALKMMEDTPSHIYFILATDQPDRLRKTLKGRCDPLPLQRLSLAQLETVISRVIKLERVKIAPGIVESICEAADGSARAALVLLQQVAGLPPDQQQLAVKEKQESETESIDLCKALLNKEKWSKVSAIVQNLKDDPESVRRHVLAFARGALLKNPTNRAYVVIDCFRNNFYDSGAAGLAYACYEAVLTPD